MPPLPAEEGADHVRLEFPLAGVARKTLHLKVAGITEAKYYYIYQRHLHAYPHCSSEIKMKGRVLIPLRPGLSHIVFSEHGVKQL